MVNILIAGVSVGLDNRYPDLEVLCRGYETQIPPAFTLRVTPEELETEKQMQPHLFSEGYLETVCIYRKLALEMLQYGVFILHASVVAVDGEGYAFLAPSGTGKTTQTKLWLAHFGQRAQVVNGDKPLIRIEETEQGFHFIAWGTPWMGKEGLGSNTSVPLKAIFFLEQSPVVQVLPATDAQRVELLFRQLLMPQDYCQMDRLLHMADKLVSTVLCYILRCDMTEESVIQAYQAAR